MFNGSGVSQMVTIRLEKPIASVEVLHEPAVDASAASAGVKETELLKLQKENLAQACGALQAAVNKVNEFRENIFREHKEQIAKLSVEIARKILLQKVREGDYEIEPIVQEALKSAPTHEDIVVHLNPEDLVQCQKAQQEGPDSTLAGVKFVADPSVGRAECLLETPKGIVESLIDEHLERIVEALKKAE